MPSSRSIRVAASFVVIALIGIGFVVVPERAKADASVPRWTSGDSWSYRDTVNANHTLRVDLIGRENTRTVLGSTYDAFHIRETETDGRFMFTTDWWIRDSDLGIVNHTVNITGIPVIITYDPPWPQARFPLSVGKDWNVTLNVSIKEANGRVSTVATSLSAQVDGESDIAVPAGTFHSFSIRTLGDRPEIKLYYSDQVGYLSKKETYAGSQKTSELVLTDYRYQWNTTSLLPVVAAFALGAIGIATFVILRRRGHMRSPRKFPSPQPPETPPPPNR